jgi:hypothetical protein
MAMPRADCWRRSIARWHIAKPFNIARLGISLRTSAPSHIGRFYFGRDGIMGGLPKRAEN